MKICKRYILLVIVWGLGIFLPAMMLPTSLAAQSGSSAIGSLSVYDKDSKLLIAEIPNSASFQLLREEGEWQIVQFDTPIVPVWASADYIQQQDGMALVTTSKLNARSAPSLDGHVISQLPAGYRVRIRDRQNNYLRLVAPRRWVFALQKPSQALVTVNHSSNTAVSNTSQISSDAKDKVVADSSASEIAETPSKLHRISPGDTISLLVFGEPDLSASNVRVPASGLVSFPLIGASQIAGKTTSEVEELVRSALAGGYVRNPKISVTIDSYRPIFIRGAVVDTGSYPFTEGLTVAKALALAGGTKNSAKSNGISISREGQTIESDLSIDSRYEISSGDIISVAEEVGVDDEAAFYIYLHGEVKSPGEYKFRRGLTVEKAVVLAGGFTLRASRKRISITREVTDQQEPEKLKNVKLYLNVQPGDIIDVGARWL